MGRIDEALSTLGEIKDTTQRALELAGLIATLFKIKGVSLVVTGQLAFDCYANTTSKTPDLGLATFSGKWTPRMLQEIMGAQLGAKGAIRRWTVVGIPVHFTGDLVSSHRELCRDFMTDHGVVKLMPAEEVMAQRILTAVYPHPNEHAQQEARLLLINALTEAFAMDWTALRSICDLPDYRVGEDLAQMRAAAQRDITTMGIAKDHVGTPEPETAASDTPPV